MSVNTLTLSTLFLLCAVIIGTYLTFIGLRRRKRIPRLGLLHAALALTGVVILGTQIYNGPMDKMNNVAVLFLIFAVIGGGMVFALREEKKPPSMPVVTIHAIMGVVGVSFLVLNLF
jgi:RsiW-degrading membrane proteinase PrsW (M82 family)